MLIRHYIAAIWMTTSENSYFLTLNRTELLLSKVAMSDFIIRSFLMVLQQMSFISSKLNVWPDKVSLNWLKQH